MLENSEIIYQIPMPISDLGLDLEIESPPSGYARMMNLSSAAAKLEGRVRHPVPSLPIRRQMADTIISILEECQRDHGGCLICDDLHPCVRFYDSHFTHRMEAEDTPAAR